MEFTIDELKLLGDSARLLAVHTKQNTGKHKVLRDIMKKIDAEILEKTEKLESKV